MNLSHATIHNAVAATGDRELIEWVEFEEDYVVSEVSVEALASHAVFRVDYIAASHPLAFRMVAHRESGDVSVTTGNPDGIRSVLQREAAVAASAQVFDVVKDLFANTPADTRVIHTPDDLGTAGDGIRAQVTAPNVDYGVDGISLQMVVVDGAGRVQQWRFELPWQGDATAAKKTLAELGAP